MLTSSCDLSAGELRAAPLASLLIEALRKKVSGELEFGVRGGTSRLYLRDGHPCGVQVFFGFKPLGQFLLELGWIDLHGLERSLMAVADGRKQGEALVSLGLLTPAQLEEGLALLHRGHLSTLAALEEGTYSFEPTSRLPAWTEAIHLRAHRSIVDAMLPPPGRAVARRIFADGLPDGEKLRLRSGWERFSPHFELSPEEERVVAQLATPQSIHEVQRGELSEHHATALMAAFLLMGLAVPDRAGERSPGPAAAEEQARWGRAAGIEPEPKRAEPPTPRRPAPAPAPQQARSGARDELERQHREAEVAVRALIEERHPLVGKGDPFAILGVARTASNQKIKQAFLQAVKLIHPDRLPGSLSHLAPQVKELFSAVTEANEILSDDARRRACLRELEAGAAAGGGIRSADVRQLVTKGESLLQQRRFSQALAFFMQALQFEEHPEIRAHAIWAANADPSRPAHARARQELQRLARRHPTCAQITHYLNALDLLEANGVS